MPLMHDKKFKYLHKNSNLVQEDIEAILSDERQHLGVNERLEAQDETKSETATEGLIRKQQVEFHAFNQTDGTKYEQVIKYSKLLFISVVLFIMVGLVCHIELFGFPISRQQKITYSVQPIPSGYSTAKNETRLRPFQTYTSPFPNGEISRYDCSLESIAYQCNMDKRDGCLNYPQLFPSKLVMENWPPQATTAPNRMFSSLCYFNMSNSEEALIAKIYFDMEVPFVVFGFPVLDSLPEKWKNDYLAEHIQDGSFEIKSSSSNVFTSTEDDTMTTPLSSSSSEEFNSFASFQSMLDENKEPQTAEKHYFLQLISDDSRNKFILEDLSPKDAPDSPQLDLFRQFLNERPPTNIVSKWRMRGNLYKGSIVKNSLLLISAKGSSRFVLSPPSSCRCLYLNNLPVMETQVNWSSIENGRFPLASNCHVSEAVVPSGHVIFIPSNWYREEVAVENSIQSAISLEPSALSSEKTEMFLKECQS